MQWHPKPAVGPYCATMCPPALPEVCGVLRPPSTAQKTRLLDITSSLTRGAAGLPGTVQLKAHSGLLGVAAGPIADGQP